MRDYLAKADLHEMEIHHAKGAWMILSARTPRPAPPVEEVS